MKRREFIKGVALVPASAALVTADSFAETMITGQSAQAGNAQAATAQLAATQSPVTAKTYGIPDYAGKILHSDMDGVGPDGKPTGQRATYTGASQADAKYDPAKPHQMTLTQEEQDILDGKDIRPSRTR
jgi:hypothetical protein